MPSDEWIIRIFIEGIPYGFKNQSPVRSWNYQYMINCAHPTHFEGAMPQGAAWLERIGGIRPNASRMSHAELDKARELDAGDPEGLGRLCAALHDRLPKLNVVGGCCGTDHRHIEQICRACVPAA
jgi:homocysteine S-methyltransferase